MPKIKPKRKLTKAQKRSKKEAKLRQVAAMKRQTETFLSQFSPDVQAHLRGEFFKKLDERRQKRQHGASL